MELSVTVMKKKEIPRFQKCSCRSWNRTRNSDLRLHRAGAKKMFTAPQHDGYHYFSFQTLKQIPEAPLIYAFLTH
jgi:hypothetical protein